MVSAVIHVSLFTKLPSHMSNFFPSSYTTFLQETCQSTCGASIRRLIRENRVLRCLLAPRKPGSREAEATPDRRAIGGHASPPRAATATPTPTPGCRAGPGGSPGRRGRAARGTLTPQPAAHASRCLSSPPAAAEPSLPQHLAHRLQHHLAAQSGLGALRVDGPFGGQAALIPDHGPAERGAAGHGSAHRGLSPLSPAAPPAPPRQWAAGGGCSARPAPLRLPPGRQLPSGARSRCLGPEVRGDTPAEVISSPRGFPYARTSDGHRTSGSSPHLPRHARVRQAAAPTAPRWGVLTEPGRVRCDTAQNK